MRKQVNMRYALLVDGEFIADYSGPFSSIDEAKTEADEYAGSTGNDCEFTVVLLGKDVSTSNCQRSLKWTDIK